ncbi:auxin-responsive protein IAA1 [Lolium perenne]|uniref:auxin-responsive protein IAA1 n=1 Tax=Lolium perenne TaxID=4522 RepID=UPI0021F54A94|nr:auxin-responsive protein IAA1-like [Lolium perenne]
MSVETERSSTESSAASGLDFEDTALTLRLPGSDPDRKRASTSDPDCPSPTAADSPPSPKAQVVTWRRWRALADAHWEVRRTRGHRRPARRQGRQARPRRLLLHPIRECSCFLLLA